MAFSSEEDKSFFTIPSLLERIGKVEGKTSPLRTHKI